MRKLTAVLSVLAVALSVAWTLSLAARDEAAKLQPEYGSAAAKAHRVEAKARLAAAKELWDAHRALESLGQGVFTDDEEMHIWSCRLLEAERALAETRQDEETALLRHWKQMEHLYRKTHALYATGSKGGEAEKLTRAKYYRAEAELWLVEAGAIVPEDRLNEGLSEK